MAANNNDCVRLQCLDYPVQMHTHVLKDLQDIIAAAAVSVWKVEENSPRTTGGLWYFSIDSKKILEKTTRGGTLTGLTFCKWNDVLRCCEAPFQAELETHLFLLVYYPWSEPRYIFSIPRNKDKMFQSEFQHHYAGVHHQALSKNSMPVLPPKTCAACGKPAKAKCSLCTQVYYCNQDCQRKDHDKHRPSCKEWSTELIKARSHFSSKEVHC